MITILLFSVLGFAFLRLWVSAYNYFNISRVDPYFLGKQPLVSVLVPCRNEEATVGRLLESLSQQDYENLEILVLDDQSTDQTLKVLQQWERRFPNFRILRGGDLPKGWLGKNYACYNLAAAAKGEYLLFLDADVVVKPGLIRNTVGYMGFEKLQLVSIFPDQEMKSTGEQLVVPLMHYLLLSLLPLAFIRRFSFPSMAAANGQFMLFDAASYHLIQPHELCRKKITEDIAIARLFKERSLRVQTLLGAGYIFARMYSSWQEGVKGFSKNLLSGFGNSALFMTGFMVFTGAVPLLLLNQAPWMGISWLAAILGIRFFNSLASNQPWWRNILLHPLQMITLYWIALNALKRTWKKENIWKGRNISEV